VKNGMVIFSILLFFCFSVVLWFFALSFFYCLFLYFFFSLSLVLFLSTPVLFSFSFFFFKIKISSSWQQKIYFKITQSDQNSFTNSIPFLNVDFSEYSMSFVSTLVTIPRNCVWIRLFFPQQLNEPKKPFFEISVEFFRFGKCYQ